jgi:putative NADH-flavin reductase
MSVIAIFGGTGFVGSRIVTEAVNRGHQVIAVSRSAPDDPSDGVTVQAGSIEDLELVRELADRADVVATALMGSVDDKPFLPALIPGILDAIGTRARFGSVGGAGSLLVSEGGPHYIDTPEFPGFARPEAGALRDTLAALRASDAETDWFVISPAAMFGSHVPGERTGAYRVGGDVMLTDEEGNSAISGDDFAIAFVDEIERPAHHRERFSVAY